MVCQLKKIVSSYQTVQSLSNEMQYLGNVLKPMCKHIYDFFLYFLSWDKRVVPTLTFCILDHFSCSFRNAIRVSNSLNQDPVRRFDSSDMGSN